VPTPDEIQTTHRIRCMTMLVRQIHLLNTWLIDEAVALRTKVWAYNVLETDAQQLPRLKSKLLAQKQLGESLIVLYNVQDIIEAQVQVQLDQAIRDLGVIETVLEEVAVELRKKAPFLAVYADTRYEKQADGSQVWNVATTIRCPLNDPMGRTPLGTDSIMAEMIGSLLVAHYRLKKAIPTRDGPMLLDMRDYVKRKGAKRLRQTDWDAAFAAFEWLEIPISKIDAPSDYLVVYVNQVELHPSLTVPHSLFVCNKTTGKTVMVTIPEFEP
jgi:hypothetical protein